MVTVLGAKPDAVKWIVVELDTLTPASALTSAVVVEVSVVVFASAAAAPVVAGVTGICVEYHHQPPPKIMISKIMTTAHPVLLMV
jgi:hypothetical protein